MARFDVIIGILRLLAALPYSPLGPERELRHRIFCISSALQGGAVPRGYVWHIGIDVYSCGLSALPRRARVIVEFAPPEIVIR